jgi:DNA-binding NarL/FixJ family response regulator
MSRILIIDDSALATELVADAVRGQLGHEVVTLSRVEDLTPEFITAHPLDVAVVDLSFADTELSGLDVLMTLHQLTPATKLVVFTQGDNFVAELLRDAWDAFDLASVISKTAPVPVQLATIDKVAKTGAAPIDPVLRLRLPSARSQWRTLPGYERLVQHAGHAKLWRALIRAEEEPSYRELAEATGLSLNTVRNYRDQLLSELALHGMDNPTMREMQVFAKRCRPFLAPFIDAKLR